MLKSNQRKSGILVMVATALGLMAYNAIDTSEPKAGEVIVLSDNSSWCWFQDERVVIDGDQLLFTGVTREGWNTVTSYNLKTGKRFIAVLNDKTFPADDHNVGVLLVRPDKKFLSVYAGHGDESKMRYRISTNPGDITQWDPEKSAETGGKTTYSNVFRLSEDDIVYNFHRGIGSDPNYMVSDDHGDTWRYGGRMFTFQGRPYVRYTSDNVSRIHFITTEEHPRHYNNGIYHGYMEGGKLFTSDGRFVGPLSASEKTNLTPHDFTTIFPGGGDLRKDVAWTNDIALDERGYPYVAFSVTKDPIALGETKDTQKGGLDHRYHYARWDGKKWNEFEIAYAGTRLYAGENEYTGLMALHPRDPNVVYISTNVNPGTGKPLNEKGHSYYEIFKGTTQDGGAHWSWTAITKNSSESNIRPIVAVSDNHEVLLWLKGRYTSYKNYDLKVVASIRPLPAK